MRRRVFKVLMGFYVILLFGMAGCGGGGGAGASATPSQSASLLTEVGWFFDNIAPDLSGNGSTCFLNVTLYCHESIAVDDIESFSITAPTGWRWTVPSTNRQLGTSSSGKSYISGKIWYGENPNAFPLAGIWTAAIKLKSGQTSSLQLTLHEPGSAADATYRYLYTKEDWEPSVNPTQYIAALARFPSQGYTLQYSAADGGKITSGGLSVVRTSFQAAEPRAYNLLCWLYDADGSYLGRTNPAYSPQDHSGTNLIADGELSIIPASTVSSTGQVDLSRVKYVRFVWTDGAQYAPSSYSKIDYRSISALVAVN